MRLPQKAEAKRDQGPGEARVGAWEAGYRPWVSVSCSIRWHLPPFQQGGQTLALREAEPEKIGLRGTGPGWGAG